MRKLALFLSMILFVGLQTLSAQTKAISGKVVDDLGEAIPGVSIVVKGTTTGTISRPDGTYNLNVPENATNLVFTFVGMKLLDVAIEGKSVINVTMKSDAVDVDEVVVTALGMTKKDKALGYAVTKVKGDALTKTKDPNIISSLAGKVSGVRITQQSGTVGGSSKIIIRGATSLGGNNQPLFVVDGMPINNDYYANGDGITGAVDYGNSAADINSMDVESVNVLKGAAATALYGSRAKNGAIIITTKKGEKGKVNLSYNTSIRFDKVAKLPDYQNKYAQGLDGNYYLKNFNGWGPEISEVQDQNFEDFMGDEIRLKAYDDNVKDFFETGHTYIHNFDLSGGDVNSDYRISFTNTTQKGIVPKSEFKKNDFTFNTGRNLNEWISVRTSGTYSRAVREGLSAQGSNDANIVVSNILTMPRTTDIKKLEDNVYDAFGNQNSWDGDGKTNNPYFILDNNNISADTERFLGSGSLTIKPTSWLTIKNQTGIDFSTSERETVYSVGTIGEIKGKWKTDVYRTRVINNDFIVTAVKKFNDNITLNALVGHNAYQKEYDRKSNEANELTAPDLYTWSNAKTNSPTNYYSKRRIHGIYGEVSFDYQDMVFLSFTGRNDFSSTLPDNNNSFFYPSASLGYIFTKSINVPSWFNFGKVRLNWANVGSDEDPYQLDFQYNAASTWFSQYGAGGAFPHAGISGFSIPRTLPNSNLKPQNQVSYEVGVDLRFFNNRVTLDGTYYVIDTEDQIVGIDVPLSTGYFSKKINAGLVRNEGVEFQLGITPVKTSLIKWDATFSFASNKTTVEELAEGLDDYALTSGWSGLQIKAEPGKAFGLYGTAWKRNNDGDIIINEGTGLREVSPNENLGKIDPDFTLGIVNNVSVGAFTLNAVIDWRQGGKMFSGTVAALRSSGLVKETLANRGTPIVDKGVNEVVGSDGSITYKDNTTAVPSMQQYWGHVSSTSNTEGSVFDATYMKLREVSLSYKLPSSLLSKVYIKGMTIGVEARNLWNIIDNVPHIDPELNFFGPSAIGGGVEFNSVPMARSYGFNVKLNF